MIILECKECDREFKAPIWKAKHGKKKFCCRKCFEKWRAKNEAGENSPTWKGGLVTQTCNNPNCNKIFKTHPSRIKAGHGKFCSRKCWGDWKTHNSIKDKSPNWKGGKEKRFCLGCNKEFSVTPAKVRYGQGKYCSKKCSGINRSKQMQGSGSPTWKGGITPIINKIRKSRQYRNWHKQVFERDCFTCCECEKRNGDLEVHHKKPFNKIIQEIKEKMPLLDLFDAAMAFAEMWDINNGITLCKVCHKKIHLFLGQEK